MLAIRLSIILLNLFFIIYTNAGIANSPSSSKEQQFVAGEHYQILPQNKNYFMAPDAADKINNKPQVIMFFSYGCFGCRQLNKEFNKWEKLNNSRVRVDCYPVAFNNAWENLAKLYYVHQAFFPKSDREEIFFEIYDNRNKLWLESEMINFYEQRYKISKEKFLIKYHSFDVDRKIKKAKEMSSYYNIFATPNIIINNKKRSYMVNFSMVPDAETLFKVVNYLTK